MTATETAGTGNGTVAYAVLLALGFVWGSSFLLIKIAERAMNPETLVLIRAASAACTLLVLVLATRRSLLPNGSTGKLRDLAVMAVIYSVIPWTLIGIGETSVSSGLASILTATAPIWTSIFAVWVTPGERPTTINYAGIVIGLMGTMVLVAPDLVGHPLNSTALGVLALIGAAIFNAASYLYQRRRLSSVDPIQAAFWQMVFTTGIMVVLAVRTFEVRPNIGAIVAAVALGVFASGLAGAAVYWLLNAIGGTRASSVNFLLPVMAVFWGATILHERVTLLMLTGMAIILAGVLLSTLRGRRRLSSD